MNDDQLLLANAYLDDDLAAADRARAETDPDVMAEIGRLRDVRTTLRAVEEPDPDARERAIAAAQAAFSGEDALPRSPAPVPLPQRARRAWYGLGAVAAALIAVAAAGFVVSRAGRSGDDDSASVATMAASSERIAAADATASTAGSGDAADAASEAAPVSDTGPRLESPADLVAYASVADTMAKSLAAAATVCSAGDLVGPATYVVDGVAVAVEVFVDGDEAVAVDAATCVEVARVERSWNAAPKAAPGRDYTPRMPGNPITDPNWAADLADTVERVVGQVRERATTPAVHVARGVVYGLLGAFLGITALTLLLIGLTRALQSLLDLGLTRAQSVYVSYLLVGGILCIAGALFLRKRHPTET